MIGFCSPEDRPREQLRAFLSSRVWERPSGYYRGVHSEESDDSISYPQGPKDESVIVRAFRLNFRELANLLIDPNEAALALYVKELIHVISCKFDALKILSVLDKHIPPVSDGGVIARIK